VVCRTAQKCLQGAEQRTDWLSDEWAGPDAAVAGAVGRQQCAVTCQSPADALPSYAASSTQPNIISSQSTSTRTELLSPKIFKSLRFSENFSSVAENFKLKFYTPILCLYLCKV